MAFSQLSRYRIGIVFAILYCVSSAGSFLSLHIVQKNFDPVLLLFYCFSLSSLFFYGLFFKKIKQEKSLMFKHKKKLFLHQLCTTITWFATFYVMKHIEPAEASALFLGLSLVFSIRLTPKNKLSAINTFDKTIAFFIALLMAADGIYLLKQSFGLDNIASLLGTVVGAWAITHGNVYNKQLYNEGLSSETILAVRFLVLIFLALLLIMYKDPSLLLLSEKNIGMVFFMALLSSIIPMYCIQKSIQYCDPVTVSFVVPCVPMVTLLIEYAHPAIGFAWFKTAFVFAFTVCVLFSSGSRLFKKK